MVPILFNASCFFLSFRLFLVTYFASHTTIFTQFFLVIVVGVAFSFLYVLSWISMLPSKQKRKQCIKSSTKLILCILCPVSLKLANWMRFAWHVSVRSNLLVVLSFFWHRLLVDWLHNTFLSRIQFPEILLGSLDLHELHILQQEPLHHTLYSNGVIHYNATIYTPDVLE